MTRSLSLGARGALLLALSGCASATVDYAELRDAASARERRAGVGHVPLGRDVRALLSRPLTADSAAAVALLNNQRTRAALEELGVARAELTRAGRLPNPTLEAAMRFDGDGRPAIEVGALIDVTELVLSLPRSDATDAELRAAKLDAVGAILDVSFEARRRFLEYQAAAQAFELRRTVAEVQGASFEVAERLHEAGNITDLDHANEQSLFEEARLEMQRAEARRARRREDLSAALGLWGHETAWRAAERLPEPPEREIELARLENDAVARSLELEATKHRFTAAARRANVARAAGWLPELKAGVSAEREEEWGVGPAVELELPIFYQGQGEAGAAEARMRAERAVYTDTAVRLRAEARSVATRLAAAREAVFHYRDALLPLRQKILDETELRYNAMLVGVFQLLQAKRDQVEAAARYIDELESYWLARTDAERLLSGRFSPSTAPGEPGATPALRRIAPGGH